MEGQADDRRVEDGVSGSMPQGRASGLALSGAAAYLCHPKSVVREVASCLLNVLSVAFCMRARSSIG